MLMKVCLVSVLAIVAVWIWQILNWVWLKPRKMERLFRKQGMKGSSYKFLFGDSKLTALMYEKAYSKPIGLNDDIVPRVMPNISHFVQEYGNYSFSWAGPRPRLFINDPGAARDALNRHRLFHRSFKVSSHSVKLLATGLVNMEGDEWTKARSKLSPSFNIDKLKPLVPAIQMCGEDILNTWKETVSNEGGSCVVDVFPHLEIFTSAILAQLMFSSKYTEDLKRTFLQLGELAVLSRRNSKTLVIPGEKYLPTQSNRRVKEIDKYVRDSFTSMINERLKRGAPSGNMDLLDIFMEELYEGKGDRQMIIEDIIGQCKIFFFAGFETSSNVLTWMMIMLSVHQDWQTRAREEVFRVLGEKKDITSDDVAKLKIVTMIINETLRLFPPAMEMQRLVVEDTKINEYTIPKDSLVTFPILMFHRSTEIWGEDAGEFRPDRFADGVMKAAKGEAAYFPFGWGPHICIGMNFAMLELKTFLSMLLRDFSFEFSPTYTHAPMVAFTVQPQFGAPVVLKKL